MGQHPRPFDPRSILNCRALFAGHVLFPYGCEVTCMARRVRSSSLAGKSGISAVTPPCKAFREASISLAPQHADTSRALDYFISLAASAFSRLIEHYILACAAAFGAVLMARYLFFVSVVPLNMALTFVRGGNR